MRKLAIISLILVLLGLCGLLFWQHAKSAKDRNTQAKLTGTWTLEMYDILRCTNVVTADGKFSRAEATYLPKGTNIYQVTGTWIVKNRDLIEKIVSTTRVGVQLPHTDIHRIVRLDDHELVALWYSTNAAVWKKVAE